MRVKYFPFKILTPLLFILNGGVYLLPKKTKPVGKELFLRYSKTFILLLDYWIRKQSLNYHSPLSHSFVNYDVIKFEKVLELF